MPGTLLYAWEVKQAAFLKRSIGVKQASFSTLQCSLRIAGIRRRLVIANGTLPPHSQHLHNTLSWTLLGFLPASLSHLSAPRYSPASL